MFSLQLDREDRLRRGLTVSDDDEMIEKPVMLDEQLRLTVVSCVKHLLKSNI